MANYGYKIYNKDFDDYFISKQSLRKRGIFLYDLYVIVLDYPYTSTLATVITQIRNFTVKGDGSYYYLDRNGVIVSGPPLDQYFKNLSDSSGGTNMHAIKGDGSLWYTGFPPANGVQVGNNQSLLGFSSPIQIGASSHWLKVISNLSNAFAIKDDGTLWAWGENSFGQLGLNDTLDRSSPTQVGSSNNWKHITNAPYTQLGVKTDGTLWAWNGPGDYGLWGDSTPPTFGLYRSSPAQVGSSTNWKQVTCSSRAAGGVKTDGTLWMWGWNGENLSEKSLGLLGTSLGENQYRSSPIQVGSDTTWSEVSLFENDFTFSGIGIKRSVAAIKTDGTVWYWGGPLETSSPVQIPSFNGISTWNSVKMSNTNIYLLKESNI